MNILGFWGDFGEVRILVVVDFAEVLVCFGIFFGVF